MLKILNQVLQDIHADRQAVYNTYPDIRQKRVTFYQGFWLILLLQE